MKMSWSKLAKARMKAIGMSQETLSEKLGVTQGAVGHWLNHRRRVGIDEIIRILHILGVSEIKVIDQYGMLEVDESQITPGPDSSISDRFLFLLAQMGWSQIDFAKNFNLSPQMVNNCVKRNSFSKQMLSTICDKTGYSLEWLENGTGEAKIKISETAKQEPKEEIPPTSAWGAVDAWDESTPLSDDEVEVPFLKDIELACGAGCCSEADYNGYKLRFSKNTLRRVGAQKDGVICFPAHGNSMEPVIPEGSTVAINIFDKRIIDGKVYAISQDGWKRLKILYRTGPNKLTIRSFNNTEYPDEEVELSSVEVLGRMFWSSTLW